MFKKKKEKKKEHAIFFIIFGLTGMFSSDSETCREILPSPYIKHPALDGCKTCTLNNYSFHSLVFKCLYSLLIPSEVLKYNVDVYRTMFV